MKASNKRPGRRKPSLRALTTAALAMPGLAGAQAPDALQTDYLFTHYKESDLPGSRNISGESSKRYQVNTHSIRAVQPFEERTLTFDLLYETLSGASPWFVQPDGDTGEPLQVMSSPTIEESRLDGQISGSTPLTETISMTLSAGLSDEDDYRSTYGNVELELTPDNGPLTFGGSFGYARDRLEPTQGTHETSILRGRKRSLRANTSATYVLNPQTLLQGALGYQEHEGFLSDPYKRVFLTDTAELPFDTRPNGRRGYHALARIRHFVDRFQGALHADYRAYRDNWKIRSHTVELTWHQTLPSRWRVSPGLRWYSQSQSFFYGPFFASAPEDGFMSSDYRLSPFGSLSFRLDTTRSWDRWSVRAGVEHYRASGSYATGSVRVESPGLVRYTAFSMGVAASF